MAFFKDSFLNALRENMLQSVCRFQYQLDNGSWKDCEINSKQIVGNSVIVIVSVPGSGKADTITAVRVLDNDNILVGEHTIGLQRSSANTALLRFAFPITEAE